MKARAWVALHDHPPETSINPMLDDAKPLLEKIDDLLPEELPKSLPLCMTSSM